MQSERSSGDLLSVETQLSDPKDDHILELAVASGISTIVTHNLKDFAKAVEFGVRAITPKQLLESME